MNPPNLLLATARAAVYSLFMHLPDIDRRPFEITHVLPNADSLTADADGYAECLASATLFGVDVAPDPIAATALTRFVHLHRVDLPIVAIACCPQCLTLWNLQALMAAGVSNVVDLRSGPEELADLLHRIIGGELVIHLELGGSPLAAGAEAAESQCLADSFAAFRPFTDADLQVLRLLSQGLPDREIGRTMHLSGHTVKHYIERLRGLAGARNRIELAAWAGRHGFSASAPAIAASERDGLTDRLASGENLAGDSR